MTPNAVKVLDGLGLRDAIRAIAHRPPRRLNRNWDTGEITSTIELGDAAEKKFGAPLLMFHRADLLDALAAALPARQVRFAKKLTGIDHGANGIEARFADGTAFAADALIGADGIHTTVREMLFGPEDPRFTGVVGFRSMVRADRLEGMDLAPFTKWWGPQRESEMVTALTGRGRDFYVFASVPQPEWRQESWSVKGDVHELRRAFAGWADEARKILAECTETLKSALYEREPLPEWTRGRVTLLGDAAHPMTPFMAQGAAMAIEDAAVLSRCVEGRSAAEIPRALQVYERTRHARTASMQRGSHENQWPKKPVDAEWVYGFDAWGVPLA
jgi:salicylate hydroxylase